MGKKSLSNTPTIVSAEKPEIKVEKPAKTIEKYTVATYALNCRKEPNGEILKVFEANTVLEVVDINGEWAHLNDGTWVMTKFIKKI